MDFTVSMGPVSFEDFVVFLSNYGRESMILDFAEGL
jgi:hypothetical protein